MNNNPQKLLKTTENDPQNKEFRKTCQQQKSEIWTINSPLAFTISVAGPLTLH